jgi:hypothetical protein
MKKLHLPPQDTSIPRILAEVLTSSEISDVSHSIHKKYEFYLCDAIDEELTVGVKGKLGDPGPSRLSYSQGRSLGQQKSLFNNLPVI